jgi:predicted nucleotidyltransferase
VTRRKKGVNVITLTDEKIAASITDQVKNLFGSNLEKVILFGSRARGDYSPDSDFDFVILANFDEPSWIVRNSYIRKHIKAADLYNVSVDYIPITPWEFENKFFFKNPVKKEGIVLYEK